ncbi:AEC family transporter [uncultured Flavonifractor sp.]|uniref:AEC family transporter n=1 Tax=uncultured Flavonifractor sp. TaxID=1193534 RepID=UPI002627F9E0|nr:AEC family transporter [uncultured Flavonifractor sp.]
MLAENFLLVASQVGTLFLLMGVGYVLTRCGKFGPETQSHTTFLLLYVVVPCLIIDTLQMPRSAHLIQVMGLCMALTLGLYLLAALGLCLLFRRQGENTRIVLRYGAMYGNIGFMGLPLAQAVLGEEGLMFAIVGLVGFTLFVWSHGVLLMGGKGGFSLKKMFLNPGMFGALGGIALFLLDFRLPAVAGNAVAFLGSMNTPLAMVIIGSQMAAADLGATFRNPRLYLSALFKLVGFPLLTALLLLPLRLEPVMYIVLVILAATPSAGYTSIFSQQYHRDTASAAQLVTLTTLCCILTLPCFAVLAGALIGR